MPKRGYLIVCLLLTLLLLFTSCSSDKNKCYYACFGDQTFFIFYEWESNSLIEVNVPYEVLAAWGVKTGFPTISLAFKNFVGRQEDGLLTGTAMDLEAYRVVLNSFCSSSQAGPKERLQALVDNATLLSKKPQADNMKELCGPDFLEITELLAARKPKVECFDVSLFIDTDNLDFAQKYFRQWLGQVTGGLI